jgi:hypothetical protein
MVQIGVISPQTTTYTYTAPYLTVAEFMAAPTALSLTDLIPDGTAAQQEQVLVDCIQRASSWIDDLCGQVLASTLDFDRGYYRVNRYGVVKVPLRYKPVLEIRTISVGTQVSNLTLLPDYSNVSIMLYGMVEIPVCGSFRSTTQPYYAGAVSVGDRVLVDVTYVNGWPNTTTSTQNLAGASFLTVDLPSGIYPGTQLNIYDNISTEQVTVSSLYVQGSSVVPLTTPLQNYHDAGVSVSNIPTRIKQACVLLTVALIQSRGDDAIILDSMEPSQMSGQYGASSEGIAMAIDLIDSMRRVV